MADDSDKSDTENLDLEFTGIFAHGDRGLMAMSEAGREARQGVDHTHAFWLNDGQWYSLAAWPNAIVGSAYLALSPLERFFLTANGKVYRRIKSAITEEIIDASDDGPSDLLLMQSLIEVEGDLYAVGMARRAYRRTGPDRWQAIDQSCFVPRAQRSEAVGFTGVAGKRHDELIAVGYKGEIWRYDGRQWHQETSPTNVTLTAIAQVSHGQFVIAGMHGTVIVGGPGRWSVVAQPEKSDLWGAAGLDGKAYVSSHDGVYLVGADGVSKVYPPKGQKNKTAFLSTGGGILWSAGLKHFASSTNGVNWTEIPPP